MATLTGKTIAATYTSLLKLEGDSGSTAAGGSAAVQVKTGDDDDTPLYLNTNRIGIGTATPDHVLSVKGGSAGLETIFSVLADDDGAIFKVIKDAAKKVWKDVQPGTLKQVREKIQKIKDKKKRGPRDE